MEGNASLHPRMHSRECSDSLAPPPPPVHADKLSEMRLVQQALKLVDESVLAHNQQYASAHARLLCTRKWDAHSCAYTHRRRTWLCEGTCRSSGVSLSSEAAQLVQRLAAEDKHTPRVSGSRSASRSSISPRTPSCLGHSKLHIRAAALTGSSRQPLTAPAVLGPLGGDEQALAPRPAHR
jgi:hypothetical protein